MTTKHTPGPWRVGDAGNTVFGPKTAHPSPVSICTISGPTPRINPEEKRANARLIAAAPDLLEALEAICARVAGEFDNPALVRLGGALGDTNEDIRAISAAAIIKARGEDA